MNKKIFLIVFVCGLFYIIQPKNIYAISSSDYQSRNNCNSKYELAIANKDESITHVSCHNTYEEANSAMQSNNSNDLVIFDSTNGNTKIVNAKYALLDLSVNPEQLTYFYESKELNTRKYTYMDTGSLYGGVDGALLDVNYNKSVKVMIGGLSAWIKDGTYEIVPLNWVKSSSSYTVTDSIRHNYVAKIQNTYSGSAGSTIGPKPDMLSTGTYYSYDGHYFYTDRLTMLKDYKNSNYNNAVNKNQPYYNYYMYLSAHSKTTYSSRNIDEYIRNNMNIKMDVFGDVSQNNSSRLYGQGTYFYYAQQRYGVNAILSLSLNRNESANGRSYIAINKNNGFGLNAVDSNPTEDANYFPTYASSILEFAYKWVTDGYADPSDSRYFGPVFGDKYIGMNVKYASDTYWSEKMAANYYSFDKAKGMQDYNYYQLGVVTSPTPAYISPTAMSQVVYTYPEKDDGVLIVDEITNAEGVWYKLQSDKIINGTTITTVGDYNWDSYVYVKKEQVVKINQPKSSYQTPNNVTEYKNSKYTYDLYTKDGSLMPKVAITQSDLDYYYDPTLEEQTGEKVLKDKWIMVYATAYDENKKAVAYLVTSNYKYDQKSWIKAGNIIFKTTGYGRTILNTEKYESLKGQYTWVNSTPHDLAETVIGGQYKYSYVPLITSTTSDGYTWYQVPVNLSGNDNSYGWTIANFKDQVSFEFTMYNADEDNKNLQIETNNSPVINASDRTITQGEQFDKLENVTAKDEEDGSLTDKIVVEGSVDIDTPGTYYLTYSVTDSKGAKQELKVTITVIKNEVPEIKAEDKVITEKEEFNELENVTAQDKEDGDLTKKIEVKESNVDTTKVGEYKITYSITDSYNQTTKKTIKVTVVKNQIPQIIASDKTIVINSKFNELENVTAQDKEDGDLTKKIEVKESNVDTTKVGEYKVIYIVKDSYGNEATKEIKINVIEKTLEKKDGEFYLNELSWDKTKKKYTISGYLIVFGINNKQTNVEYQLILKNIDSNEEYSIDIDPWIKDVPYNLGSENGNDYSYSWYKDEIDMSNIPAGDYELYMKAIKGDYYTEQLVDNLFNKAIDRRAEDDNNGYSFKVMLSLKSKKIQLSVRKGNIITTSTSNTFRNMVNDYDDMEFVNNKLQIKGTSYNYGGTYSESSKIIRTLILEETTSYKQYTYDLGSTNLGSYKVISTDSKDKSYAWYNKSIDVSNLPKGTYSMIVYTKTTDSEDYGEICDIFASINEDEATISGKKYKITLNKSKQNRIELVVK